MVFSFWHIWKTWCDYVFNQLPIKSTKVLMAISNLLEAFSVARGDLGDIGTSVSAKVGLVPSWSLHAAPFYKVNVDASWSMLTKTSFVGVGVMVRATEGDLFAVARYAITTPSAALVEAFALLRGCKVGSFLGLICVVFKSDSLESISCLYDSMDDGCWEAFPILMRVKELEKSFYNCRWSWVPRSTNDAADGKQSRDV